MIKILLVEDEPDVVEFLKYNLEREKFKVIVAYNGEEALKRLNENPDLVLLDILMPGLNGFEVCKQIKADDQYKNIPVIFLTALSQEQDEIRGLTIGGSDFIQKPISPSKLIARVKSNLRFSPSLVQAEDQKKINYDRLRIDPEMYRVFVDGREKFFPKKEFQVLYLLASNPGKVLQREFLLNNIWGNDVMVIERTVDVHIRKIREKLGTFSNAIATIKGIGYKFELPSEA